MITYRQTLAAVLHEIETSSIGAIGHRVVHGGDLYTAPTFIDDTVVQELRSIVRLAPQHLPASIETMEAARQRFPNVEQIACFDTAFHSALPEIVKRFPLPEKYWNGGVRRYGFHGLSFEYIMQYLGTNLPKRTIIAHLGNGSSMVALREGHPVDTTMGMTPAGGLMMGSRSGDLDPGVLVHLLREIGMSVEALDTLVNKDSGLKGVSGLTGDMKTLLEKRSECPSADLAIQMYCYQARKHIGALSAVLGGLDLLVFTGGVGENAREVRKEILQGLDYLQCESKTLRTDESRMIAQHVKRVTGAL